MAYKLGDATAPDGPGSKIIVHICNDRGGWGKGFVLALSRRYPEPEAAYRQWHAGRTENDFGLGAVQFVPVRPGLWVANVIGQHGYATANGVPPVRYEAIEKGLTHLAAFAQTEQATVHMPRIGCGLAGGEWSEIEKIVRRTLVENGASVTVYDLPAAT